MAQVAPGSAVHDVVVIGSGAGGGTATKVLADLGVNVLLLEAGPMLNMADLKEHMWPYNVPHRGAGAKGQAYTGGPTGFTYSATFGGAQIEGEPYTVAPGSDFSWFRSRVLGGRTNHYGRVTLRMSDYDFKPRSTDGLGWDWPISYDDLAPYYDKAERFIGVVGSAEGIRSAPDGIFHTPAPLRAHDVLVQRACAKQGIRAVVRAPGRHHPPGQRPAGVSLLRPVRPRLHDGVELRRQLRADLPGDEDRPREGDRQRHGARADHGRDRQGDGGLVRRQDERQRTAGALPDGRARRKRVRVGAPAAQLEVVAASAGAGEQLGQSRPLPDGHRRLERVGDDPGAVGHAALQLGWLRIAPLRPVVAVGQAQDAELPARIPHRSRRRLRHAGRRLVHRASSTGPKATASG